MLDIVPHVKKISKEKKNLGRIKTKKLLKMMIRNKNATVSIEDELCPS